MCWSKFCLGAVVTVVLGLGASGLRSLEYLSLGILNFSDICIMLRVLLVFRDGGAEGLGFRV